MIKVNWEDIVKKEFRGITGKESIDGTCKMRTPMGFCGRPTKEGKMYCSYCQKHIDNMNRLNRGD